MCGRFSFSPLAKIIEDRFDVKVDASVYRPKYNCAPTQNLAVITNREPEKLSFLRWGLIPFWAKDPSIGNRLINARAETIEEKASFKNSFRKKRCLVLSDSFYEWKTSGRQKIPYRIKMSDDGLFAMAGIWDSWKNEGGDYTHSFSIITTTPNELMKEIHTRMPVILDPGNEKRWLCEEDPGFLKSLLTPFPFMKMTAYPVSTRVNSPGKDGPVLHEPVEYP
ncbi:MAG: SOS response-associated peptidase [Bacteroidales bacterium]|nr:SOS response-associated peptidase [Bacteroidales bacterium]